MTRHHHRHQLADGLVEIDGALHYRITDVDRLPPFLMSLVSDGDRWMFLSSSGPLTAGRRDATRALFPYVTDDRLHASVGKSGPVTLVRVADVSDQQTLWEPFAEHPNGGTRRSVAKTVLSDSVVFEERHERLGLTFSYRWSSADRFGLVRSVTLRNDRRERVTVDVIDGLLDVLPYGADPSQYQRFNNLTNAYKRSEAIDDETGLAVFTLESPVSDRPEPAEVLRATTVWSTGLSGSIDLSGEAFSAFRLGRHRHEQHLVTGLPGAYFRRGTLDLEPGASADWMIVADVARDHNDVAELRRYLDAHGSAEVMSDVNTAKQATAARLETIVSPSDSAQLTGHPIDCAHHLSNVIFNVMRGGIPLDGYRFDGEEFARFVNRRNRDVANSHASWLGSLSGSMQRRELIAAIQDIADADLTRLADEYLPFGFSRRHGDPSRPWNTFSINVSDERGDPVKHYEGNWRDVFQNWEALCASYPEFLPGVVSLFVNASTADGYNPYRITTDGIDWEVPDPHDPWSNIGYWGDHQIVYLLRLLEATERHLPGEISLRLGTKVHPYADVPYRIVSYERIVKDPKDTIEFDQARADETSRRTAALGGDGQLLTTADGETVVVTLLEKLVVAALAKLSNFVPGGGIWMNTQRPEWNDANNALVGYGVSMVTLFHLRAYLDYLRKLLEREQQTSMSVEVHAWLIELVAALRSGPVAADSDTARRELMDVLGQAASRYRASLYDVGLSGDHTTVDSATIVELCDVALRHLDATIDHNRRPDGLTHTYNLLDLSGDGTASIEHLHEMLEGQVAALTTGHLAPDEQADLIDALFDSALYRTDQRSFTLAPPTPPPAFLDKNVIPADVVDRSPLISALVDADDVRVVRRDADGVARFAPELHTLPRLEATLDELALDPRWAELVAGSRGDLEAAYELVFGHRSYLGRSGSMYGFEGIGSIYWHMVSKLLLAVQEAAVAAGRDGASADATARLVAAYWRVREGLGFNKTPSEFGAIPTDPYSHTPAHAGAQQPGMTGAVKEELLARWAELGVSVIDGEIVFDPLLVRSSEFVTQPTTWTITAIDGTTDTYELGPGTFGLTLCQVPIVVSSTGDSSIEIEFADGRTERIAGSRLGRDASRHVFGRTGEIIRVRAFGVRPPALSSANDKPALGADI